MTFTRHSINTTLLLLILSISIVGCNSSADNKNIEASKYGEKTKIFLGYKLGMTKQEFYDHSWKLNDKQMVRQGPYNQSVRYELDNELSHPAEMFFYPNFHNKKIYQMRARFEYANWAPWNKELYSKELQRDVLNLFRDWYGEGFQRKISKNEKKKRIVYIKRDKNRRVAITTKGDKAVRALITDVVAAKEASSDN